MSEDTAEQKKTTFTRVSNDLMKNLVSDPTEVKRRCYTLGHSAKPMNNLDALAGLKCSKCGTPMVPASKSDEPELVAVCPNPNCGAKRVNPEKAQKKAD